MRLDQKIKQCREFRHLKKKDIRSLCRGRDRLEIVLNGGHAPAVIRRVIKNHGMSCSYCLGIFGKDHLVMPHHPTLRKLMVRIILGDCWRILSKSEIAYAKLPYPLCPSCNRTFDAFMKSRKYSNHEDFDIEIALTEWISGRLGREARRRCTPKEKIDP